MKRLCDEVFGEENALGPFIQDKQNSKNDTLNIQKNHDLSSAIRRLHNLSMEKRLPFYVWIKTWKKRYSKRMENISI